MYEYDESSRDWSIVAMALAAALLIVGMLVMAKSMGSEFVSITGSTALEQSAQPANISLVVLALLLVAVIAVIMLRRRKG